MGRKSGGGYHEIAEYYENLIHTGRLAPGEMLPTEMELSEKHSVTRTTIRRAFEGLVKKGLVSRQQGRGTFVAIASDVEARRVSHVLIAVPAPVSFLPAGDPYVRETEDLYRLVESITSALSNYARPFHVCFFKPKEEPFAEISEAARKNADIGIIAYDVDRKDLVDGLVSLNLPLVFVDSLTFGAPVNLVKADSFHGAKAATQYLLQTTPGPLAFVGSHSVHKEGSPHKDRLDGFRAAHAEAGRPLDEGYVMIGWATPKIGQRAVAETFKLAAPPTGFFCSDDEMAKGVIDELHVRGISVPRQVSVFGFGDSLYSRTTVPHLSTIAMDLPTMGQRAADMLNETLANPKAPHQTVTVPVSVLYRQTTIIAPPAGMPGAATT